MNWNAIVAIWRSINWDAAIAICTGALALFTAVMAWFTRKSIVEATPNSRRRVRKASSSIKMRFDRSSYCRLSKASSPKTVPTSFVSTLRSASMSAGSS